MTVRRVVVVGGDAAGMSAASQAKRLRPELDVVVLERGRHVSYSACGIPYWVAGDIGSADELVARTADEHRANGIDVRLRAEAVRLDVGAREVHVRHLDEDRDEVLPYDELVVATGAVPVRPPLPGIDAEGVFGVQTLDDGAAVIDWLAGLGRSGGARCRAVVIGAGYIGVEMAEALFRHGLDVTVVDKAPEPMTTLDPDMGRLVHDAMEGLGLTVLTGTDVASVETDADGRVAAVVTSGGRIPADVVVLGIGVRPRTELARDAGLPIGEFGGLLVDDHQRVDGHPGVWAAGDCVEVLDRLTGRSIHVALGTHANKQGRALGTNLAGGSARFDGVVGTAVSKVCDLEIARTGLREDQARAAGFEVVTATVESTTRAGYYPGAAPMTVKALADRGTGQLLGVQIVGREGSAKRIDTAATALWNAMTARGVAGLDLAYAPPFSPVWDPVQIAARKVADELERD